MGLLIAATLTQRRPRLQRTAGRAPAIRPGYSTGACCLFLAVRLSLVRDCYRYERVALGLALNIALGQRQYL